MCLVMIMKLRYLLVHALVTLLLFTSSTTAAKITGTVFEDVDASGTQDPGGNEFGIQGVDVVITDAGGATTTVTTDEAGMYVVEILPATSAKIDVDETTLPDPSPGTWLQTAGFDPSNGWGNAGLVTHLDGYCLMNVPTDCCSWSTKNVWISEFYNGSGNTISGIVTIDFGAWAADPDIFPVATLVPVTSAGPPSLTKWPVAITVGFTGLTLSVVTPLIDPIDWYRNMCGEYKVRIILNLTTLQMITEFVLPETLSPPPPLGDACRNNAPSNWVDLLCWEMTVTT